MPRRRPRRRQAARRRPSRPAGAPRYGGRPAGRPFSFKSPLIGWGDGQAVLRGAEPQLQHRSVAAEKPPGTAGQRKVDELLVVAVGATQMRSCLRCRRVLSAMAVPSRSKFSRVCTARRRQTPVQYMRHLVAHRGRGQPADAPSHDRSRKSGHRGLAEQEPDQHHVRVEDDARQCRCKRELTRRGINVFCHLVLLEGAGPNTIAGFSGVRPVGLARPRGTCMLTSKRAAQSPPD